MKQQNTHISNYLKNNNMIILGINAYHADASAAILVNGELIAATEEERFTRTKHWAGFPVQAIQFCLEEAEVDLDEVDYICIGRDPKAKFSKKMAFMLQSPLALAELAAMDQTRYDEWCGGAAAYYEKQILVPFAEHQDAYLKLFSVSTS